MFADSLYVGSPGPAGDVASLVSRGGSDAVGQGGDAYAKQKALSERLGKSAQRVQAVLDRV